ncbi:MAG: DUF2007 domain-containing protein [Phycisphaerae bacterium]|nr:DUF2007 domain-containing protein [Bacteroidota bacterium]MBL7107282.1 DUF2007 domain-containing protein [Phycisphaerae bacterium]
MAKRGQKSGKSKVKSEPLAAVTFLDNYSEVEECQLLLESNGIPVIIKDVKVEGNREEFAVLVAEEYLEDAQYLIENETNDDDFYGFEFDLDDEFEMDFERFDDEF